MAEIPRVCLWAGGGAVLAVGAAWLLSSPGGQAKLSAHFTAAMSSGTAPDTVAVPGGVPKWQPYRPAGGGHRRRPSHHPAAASPNLTMVQQGNYDWLFYPPSEGDV